MGCTRQELYTYTVQGKRVSSSSGGDCPPDCPWKKQSTRRLRIYSNAAPKEQRSSFPPFQNAHSFQERLAASIEAYGPIDHIVNAFYANTAIITRTDALHFLQGDSCQARCAIPHPREGCLLSFQRESVDTHST